MRIIFFTLMSSLILIVVIFSSQKETKIKNKLTIINDPRPQQTKKNNKKSNNQQIKYVKKNNHNKIILVNKYLNNQKNIAKVKKEFKILSGYLNIEKAREKFRESPLNSQQNIQVALDYLIEPYKDKIDKKVLEKRIIFLRMLKYTDKITIEDGLTIISKLEKNLSEKINNKNIKGNIMFDILSISKICGRLDIYRLKRFLTNNVSNEYVKSQIKLGIEYLNGEQII